MSNSDRKSPAARSARALLLSLLAATALAGAAVGSPARAEPQTSADPLLAGFKAPPQSARPRVWWHWIDGNINLDGAKLDLDWMKRVGVGGVHTFSGGFGLPPVVPAPQPFMSEGWRKMFAETTRIAHANGMEVSIAGSPGWSQTGGVWVAPADAMKKLIWSVTEVEGGRRFDGVLKPLPVTAGPFQGVKGEWRTPAKTLDPSTFGVGPVIAFPTPKAERVADKPALFTASGPFDATALASGDLSRTVALPLAGGDSAWIEARYAAPTRLSAVTLGSKSALKVELLASDDGKDFRRIFVAEPDQAEHPAPQRTYAFAPSSARIFRLVLSPAAPKAPLPGAPAFLFGDRGKPAALDLTKVAFEAGARIDRFEAKAGFQPTLVGGPSAIVAAAPDGVIDRSRVIDLSDKISADGNLVWTPPAGQWTVLRLGWSLTGQTNGPAEASATGLEVDKLDPAAVRRYIDAYLKLYEDASGGQLGPEGVQNLLTDSWEAGVQNWTPTLLAQFKARRGYDPTPFLPTLVGRVVETADASERFLWDYRLTLKEMLADNHYGVLANALHERGMGYYTEAMGDTPRAIGDGLANKARSDIPTAEYWYRPFATAPGQPSLKADLAEAASAAHLYGKPLVAAESMTVAAANDMWAFSPAMLKPVADEIFALGVNRILVHDSHHQPIVDGRPGLALFFFGQFFNRNDTWSEQAGPWVDYLTRTSYLLQQGRFVADVAYFYGEDQNLTEQYLDRFNTDVPQGYRYDYVNREALLTRLSAADGKIQAQGGASYRVLYMPKAVDRLTLATLRKLAELVSNGAVLVGERPVGALGLQDSDAAVQILARELWGEAASASPRSYGKGKVYATADLAAALNAEGIAPDVTFAKAGPGADLLSLHRRTDDADLYFISNQKDRAESVEASFRVAGKAAEFWNAQTGAVTPLAYRNEGDRTITPLELGPHDSGFVVLRGAANPKGGAVTTSVRRPLATLEKPWRVTFEPGRGGPTEPQTFASLSDWTHSDDPGVKYFSGAATYAQRLDAPKAWLASGNRIWLDLGDVRELAEVVVNGETFPTLWRAPFAVDITDALKVGTNDIAVKVVNLWPNRLIGDKQPNAKPIAFAPSNFYRADSKLLPSGLLGPVRIISEGPR